MLIFDQIKNDDRPLWSLTLGILAGLLVLLGGLWYLQVVSTRRYVESQKTQSFRKVRFPALRGKILDRNGQVLAENRPSYNINLYLEELSPQFKEVFRRAKSGHKWSKTQLDALGRQTRYMVVSNIVQQLGCMLELPLHMDVSDFNKHYTNRLVLPITVLTNATFKQIARFCEHPNKPAGLNLDMQALRVYPNGALAAHVLGQLQRIDRMDEDEDKGVDFDYCLPDFKGIVGIEGAFDQELRGSAGVRSIMVNNLGYRQSETVWSPADPGNNVVLTIDVRIQRAAEKALRENGLSTKGAAVVMDARNGDILALASVPSFDPNEFASGISSIAYAKLDDPQNWPDPDWNPQLSRATFGTYAPSSIFKIVVALAGLEAGTLNPDELIQTQSDYRLNARSKPVHDLAAPGKYNLRLALAASSNYYFIVQGLRAGFTNIMNMGRQFFLGQRTGIPLMQEVTCFFPSPEWIQKKAESDDPLHPGDTVNLSIGQGFLTVTPLQMAVLTAAVANGGTVYRPRLVSRIETPEHSGGAPVKDFPGGQVRGEVKVEAHHLELIRQAMLADVEAGTGRAAAVPGLQISGKTGTAQFMVRGESPRHDTWFVSFAPFDHPHYVVVTFVEAGSYGGTTCAPIARKIYEEIKRLESIASSKRPTIAQNASE
jgi:penicillin-binding protein 2